MTKRKRILITDKLVLDLQELFEKAAITYPKHILKRRLKLLNYTERKMVKNELLKIEKQLKETICNFYNDKYDFIENIDDIICNRAEEENDKWK